MRLLPGHPRSSQLDHTQGYSQSLWALVQLLGHVVRPFTPIKDENTGAWEWQEAPWGLRMLLVLAGLGISSRAMLKLRWDPQLSPVKTQRDPRIHIPNKFWLTKTNLLICLFVYWDQASQVPMSGLELSMEKADLEPIAASASQVSVSLLWSHVTALRDDRTVLELKFRHKGGSRG